MFGELVFAQHRVCDDESVELSDAAGTPAPAFADALPERRASSAGLIVQVSSELVELSVGDFLAGEKAVLQSDGFFVGHVASLVVGVHWNTNTPSLDRRMNVFQNIDSVNQGGGLASDKQLKTDPRRRVCF